MSLMKMAGTEMWQNSKIYDEIRLPNHRDGHPRDLSIIRTSDNTSMNGPVVSCHEVRVHSHSYP